MTELIKKFYVEDSQGKCTDNIFEFGNTHRKTFNCSFCSEEGSCHYKGECDRRNILNKNLGWRVS